jgi:hypothetical protein
VKRRLVALALALGLSPLGGLGPAAAAPEPAQALAVVIGSNESPSPSLERLRYADDDAIQNARTLALLGVRPQLLVTPDAETRELFPAVRADGAATRAAVVAAFDRNAGLTRQARARGQATSLYIFVAAHGDAEGDRAFLQLDDGRLWREDLAELARRVGADQTHVVIDACQASAFVGARGPGGDRFPLGFGFSRDARGPSWPPHTGFLTARSSGGQTHEWTEFQAGIFSHEVRSGLLGGADVNRDGRVTYAELGAFIRRANELIPNRKYRPEVLTAPPGGALEAVVATLPPGPLLLDIEGKAAGRASVESERGVRLADVHVAPGGAVSLRLPTDLGAVFVALERPPSEFRVAPEPGRVVLSQLVPEPPRARARGAAHEAFRRLFARPFDAGAVAAFRADVALAAETPEPEPPRTALHTAGLTAAAVGVVGLATGGVLLITARQLSQDGMRNETLTGLERDALNRRIDGRNRWAVISGGAGAAVLGAGLGMLLWQGGF